MEVSTSNGDSGGATSSSLLTSSSIHLLLEKIKKQATNLAEAKVFDRVSLASSVYNDNILDNNSFCSTEVDMKQTGSDQEGENNELESLYNKNNRKNLKLYEVSSFSEENAEECESLDSLSSSKCSLTSESSISSSNSSSYSTTTSSSSSSSNSGEEQSRRKINQEHNLVSRRKTNKKSKHLINKKPNIRRELLLEKAANLGSSPITLLQAIAAKALNFKLKKSKMNQQRKESILKHTHQPYDYSSSSSSGSTSNSSLSESAKINKNDSQQRRLIRQYKFLKATKMKMGKIFLNIFHQILHNMHRKKWVYQPLRILS